MTMPTRDTLLALLKRKKLNNLVDELKQGVTTFEDRMARTETQWKEIAGAANGIDIYNALHPQPTIAQFLKNPLPSILKERPRSLSTKSERVHPRRPKNVIAWPEFKQGAIAFQYPDSLAHAKCIIRKYAGTVINTEIPDVQGIIHAHLDNFNLIFAQIGSTYRFKSRTIL